MTGISYNNLSAKQLAIADYWEDHHHLAPRAARALAYLNVADTNDLINYNSKHAGITHYRNLAGVGAVTVAQIDNLRERLTRERAKRLVEVQEKLKTPTQTEEELKTRVHEAISLVRLRLRELNQHTDGMYRVIHGPFSGALVLVHQITEFNDYELQEAKDAVDPD